MTVQRPIELNAVGQSCSGLVGGSDTRNRTSSLIFWGRLQCLLIRCLLNRPVIECDHRHDRMFALLTFACLLAGEVSTRIRGPALPGLKEACTNGQGKPEREPERGGILSDSDRRGGILLVLFVCD